MLADDSAAVRKVIELTFADEGMEVFTVGDGRSALERFEQVVPDLVMADVFMPEMGGYELCRYIKQDERFAKTPVVLLISSFEPFDESEARRAGADDVVTKPFQSIRQLVSRVGSLLNKGEDEPQMTHQYSTLGIDQPEPVVSAPMEHRATEPQVTVLVEADVMEHPETSEPAGVTCSTDVDLLTADTMQLERVVDEPIQETSADEMSFQDTIEVEPIPVTPIEDQPAPVGEPSPEPVHFVEVSEAVSTQSPVPRKFDDAVLDLEDEDLGEPQMVADDVFLDLDFEESGASEIQPEAQAERVYDEPAATAFTQAIPAEPAEVEQPPALVTTDEWSPAAESSDSQWAEPAPAQQTVSLMSSEAEGLSPAVVEAIARRMVEQMSDKVVREIAWEVVPEMSELLIKQKLNEPK